MKLQTPKFNHKIKNGGEDVQFTTRSPLNTDFNNSSDKPLETEFSDMESIYKVSSQVF